MAELKIGLLYISLHNQLAKKFGVNSHITKKDLFTKLGKHYMIPKPLRPLIIKEMINKNLLERIDRDNLKILCCDFDLEKDSNKLYNHFGIS